MTPPSSPAPRAPSRELDAEIAERVMGWTRADFRYCAVRYGTDGDWSGSFGMGDATLAEITAAIARYPAVGWQPEVFNVPSYSTDISAAWLVVDALIQQNASVDVSCAQGRACCEVWGENAIGMEAHVATEFADTAPLAICQAALAAAARRSPEAP